jgi:hypothetical protein
MKKYATWTVTVARIALALAVLGGAQLWRSRAPDLRRLYQSGMERARVPPVIIIPGHPGITTARAQQRPWEEPAPAAPPALVR